MSLWDVLGPATGAAATVQDEAILISGRIAHEILDNGGGNWDAGYAKMLSALHGFLSSGRALSAADLAEVGDIGSSLLAVAWISVNPTPVSLPSTHYKR